MNFKTPVSRMETGLLLLALVTAPLMGFTVPQQAMPQKMESPQKLPPPGPYKIDPAHSFAYFGARHHVVGLVRGRFDKVTGTVTSAKDPSACALDVTIDVASINTQIKQRDEDLLGTAYFDVKSFPTMTYKGQGLRHVSGNQWIMDGTLTMHGVTKTVPLTFTFNGAFADTPANEPMRVAFHGTAAVKRADFNMGSRDNLSELGMLTSPDVSIEIDVEADAAGAAK
jgi:polyisoprenoid-binding protein YceI